MYRFLGLTVGMVQEEHSQKRRRGAFGADITYVTSNALGFTHLNDTSTCMSLDDLVGASALLMTLSLWSLYLAATCTAMHVAKQCHKGAPWIHSRVVCKSCVWLLCRL